MKQLVLLALFLLTLTPSIVSAQEPVSIKIVKPGDRRNVELGEIPVTVEISGEAVTTGYSWQMLIDGVPQGMVRHAVTTNITIPKPTGPHHLAVQLYDASGNVVASDDILVIAAPVENRDPIFNRPWFAPTMFGFTLVVIGIIVVSLRLGPRTAT